MINHLPKTRGRPRVAGDGDGWLIRPIAEVGDGPSNPRDG